MLVTFVTGSIHSFSVFLVPLELLLELPRAKISLIYSFALVFLTLSVLLGYLVYEKIRPATMVFLACIGAAAGLLISSLGTTYWQVFSGYSILFGTFNGLAYGYVLQLAGRALPDHRGFAMAAVTAAYAVGSVVFSIVLARLVELFSLYASLTAMGSIIFASGGIAAILLHLTRASYDLDPGMSPVAGTRSAGVWAIVQLWLAYGCSVFAGLMAIGHAAGIVGALGGSYSIAVWGAVFIGAGSAIGGFYIGSVIGRSNMNHWLTGLPLSSALVLVLLIFVQGPYLAIAGLCVVGFCYGAIIAVYPYAISEFYGSVLGPKVYGRVFTAWGFSGLCGPLFAGFLYDRSGDYSTALGVAGVISLVSSMVYFFFASRGE